MAYERLWQNLSETLRNDTAQFPEQVILVCVVCANMTLYPGQLNTLNRTLSDSEDETSPFLIQGCKEDSLDFEEYTVSEEDRGEGFISDSLRRLFETINFSILQGTISVLGSIANVINIIVFSRQKFSDSVNISLLGLALSDLGALLTLVWMSVCFSPLLRSLSLTFDPVEVQYLTAGWPHVCFARITSYITAYVTLERCLCVTVPLKVKMIITPRRTTVTITLIFLVLFASVAPVYFGIGLGSVTSTTVTYYPNSTTATLTSRWSLVDNTSTIPITNKNNNSNSSSTFGQAVCTVGYVRKVSKTLSTMSLVYAHNGAELENISFSIGVFAQLSSFVSVIVCTVMLVRALAQNSRWRSRTTNLSDMTSENGGSGAISQRDKRLVKMITLLSTIFIICFLPSAVNLIIMICSAEYSIVGRYRNMFQVGWSFFNCLEATNSSVNIFVYYNMSSRYRKGLKALFRIPEKETTNIDSSG